MACPVSRQRPLDRVRPPQGCALVHSDRDLNRGKQEGDQPHGA